MDYTPGHEKLELYVSCKDLAAISSSSVVNPQVKLFMLDNDQWKLHSASELVQDNNNPTFTNAFCIDFIFEVQQCLKFEVYDMEKVERPVGTAETTVGAIMGANKQTLNLGLIARDDSKNAKLIVSGIKVGGSSDEIVWQWSGEKLMNTDFAIIGRSDPFLKFFKLRDGHSPLLVHETERIDNNLNPLWKVFDLRDDKLCDGNYAKLFMIECWDHENSGKHQFIGRVELTLNQIKNGQDTFQLVNPKSKAPGALRVKLFPFKCVEQPTIGDYIRGGQQLNFVAAIDFTASNGDLKYKDSLHAMRSNSELNDYQTALKSVGEILLNYDQDKKVPSFGFGAKFDGGKTSHCFPCNGDESNPQVNGMEGIMEVYQKCLSKVKLSGPTYFSHLLNKMIEVCNKNEQNNSLPYTILLILTDGSISDEDTTETCDLIVKASALPLSIIIVGVGKDDFKEMNVLDGDHGKMKDSKGNEASRDIVQFVPFSKVGKDKNKLAEFVLAEVPKQFASYMKSKDRKPNKSF